jgi:hypothetical protein
MRTLFSEPKRPIDWLKNRFEKSWERVRRRKGTGRPRTDRDVHDLIRTMTRANPTWGMPGLIVGNWESWESRLARRRSTSIAFGKEARRRPRGKPFLRTKPKRSRVLISSRLQRRSFVFCIGRPGRIHIASESSAQSGETA